MTPYKKLVDAMERIAELEQQLAEANKGNGITLSFAIDKFTTRRLKVELIGDGNGGPTYLRFKDTMSLTIVGTKPVILKLEMLEE